MGPSTTRNPASPDRTPSETYELLRGVDRLLVASDVPRVRGERWLDELPGLLEATERRPRGIRVVPTDGESVAVKVGRGARWKRLLRRLTVSPTRSQRAFDLALQMRAAGLPTPRPLAVLDHRRGAGDLLVSEFLPVASLHGALAESSESDSLTLIRAVARELAGFHAAGFRHRDLKTQNVLVRVTPGDAAEVWWIDLDGAARLGSPAGTAIRVRDLARLRVSLEVLGGPAAALVPELIDSYLAAAGRVAERAHYLDGTERWARRVVARNRRTGRSIT